ncbi:MAG: glucose-6-phosphate isomerase [Pseudomonadota bacterium]
MQLHENPAYARLAQLAREPKRYDLRRLIKTPGRSDKYRMDCGVLNVDMTRHQVDDTILAALCDLARGADLELKRDAMLQGAIINQSEERPVTHSELRKPDRLMHDEWRRLAGWADQIRNDPTVTDIVNIGIGGSDLGPKLVTRALAPVKSRVKIHYVSNIDPAHLHDTLALCKGRQTRFIIASKTFTTSETLANLEMSRAFLAIHDVAADRAMVAVTADPAAAKLCGFSNDTIFPFDVTIGGRYSLWSSVGLSVLCAIGPESFAELLQGAHLIDRHFAQTPIAQNVPVLLALLRIWNRNFLNRGSHGIMVYGQRLEHFPAWVQQLEMESNGKGVDLAGRPLQHPASPLIWGDVGTNAQHSFFQFLHQGLDQVPLDFLFAEQPAGDEVGLEGSQDYHRLLVINALAQADTLAIGEDNQNEPHRHFPGNRPCTIISWPLTSAYQLGQLLALYEHITTACGFIWGVNSFDQWGVELGKKQARQQAEKCE